MPIDINSGGNVRPGGIPVHVVTPLARPTIAGAPGSVGLGAIVAKATHGVRTFDPFAVVGRARRALGRTISR